jgi:outer membrane protein X
MSARAQEKGDMAVGASLTVGTGNDFSNFGLGAKFQYNVINPLRLEGAFTCFLPKDRDLGTGMEGRTGMWDLSVNAHWLFPVASKITVYPLAGLSLLGTSSSLKIGALGIDRDDSSSELGCNLGGGVDLKLTDRFIFNVELKYRAGTWNRFLASAGVAYRF